MFTDFLTSISPALQNLLLALVTAFVGGALGWLRKQYLVTKSKFSQEQQYLIEFLVSRAVSAVEQLYKDEPSQTKKAQALAIVEKALAEYGIKVDLDVIAAAIEAEVFNKNQSIAAHDAFIRAKGKG